MFNKCWIKCGFIYIGTIIGAGFASGQEIIHFFGVYGIKGLYGVLLATILFSIIPIIVLLRIKSQGIIGYDEFMKQVFGSNIGGIIEIILTLFLFISYSIMLSGGGAILKQQLGISNTYGIYILAFLTFMTFIYSIKGLSYVNTLLIPLLVTGIIFISYNVIHSNGLDFSNFHGVKVTKNGNWITSSFLYVSYNSLSSVIILSYMISIIKSKKDIIKTGIFGGVILGIIAISILVPILIKYTDVFNLEIPMLNVASSVNKQSKILYSIILIFAMFTTAIASGFSFIMRISKATGIKKNIISIILPLITIPISRLGFSNLVKIFYPLFGYLGFFVFLVIIIESILRFIKLTMTRKLL